VVSLVPVVRRRILQFFHLVLVVVLSSASLVRSQASATVLLGVDFDAQCAEADRIFVGTVRAIESRRNPTAPRYFETIVTFNVDEAVAGTVRDTVSLRFAGGQIGDERQSIDGMPEFTSGERYIVFMAPDHDPPLASSVVGFNQGLYTVISRVESAGPRAIVRDRLGHPLDTRALSDRASAAMRAETTVEPGLDDFLSAIRAVRSSAPPR
jgi:hypothetical protein